MTAHAIGSFGHDEGGARIARCSCGVVLRMPTLDGLATAIGNHVVQVDDSCSYCVNDICVGCGGTGVHPMAGSGSPAGADYVPTGTRCSWCEGDGRCSGPPHAAQDAPGGAPDAEGDDDTPDVEVVAPGAAQPASMCWHREHCGEDPCTARPRRRAAKR